MQIQLLTSDTFGTVNLVGHHCRPESLSDVTDAIQSAERDGFDTVYVYVCPLEFDCRWLCSPWREHGRSLTDTYSKLCEALTFKQYQQWSQGAPDTYRRRFELALKLSKRERVQAIAREGLRLVQLCESQEAERKWVADLVA